MNKPRKRKVYFVASLVAKEEFGETFKQIARIFRDLGYAVSDDVNKVTANEARDYTDKEIREYYKSVQKRIKESDIFVAELSKPSSAVGYEIGFAVANDKPSLILRSDKLTSEPGAPLRGNPSKHLNIFKYNKYNLRERIESFLKKAERGIFIKRVPIEFTQDQLDHIQYRQKREKRPSFNATVRLIIDEDIESNQ
jgi:nucleoside 2-deoxyribosyltransferase